MGAGASLPVSLGGVRRMQRRAYSAGGGGGGEGGGGGDEKKDHADGDGRYFHLLVGTTTNCVAEVSFRTDESTNILDLEVEVLVQGHAGAVVAVAEVPSADQVKLRQRDKKCGKISGFFLLHITSW